jgi:hypothetical protein
MLPRIIVEIFEHYPISESYVLQRVPSTLRLLPFLSLLMKRSLYSCQHNAKEDTCDNVLVRHCKLRLPTGQPQQNKQKLSPNNQALSLTLSTTLPC